MAISKGEDLPNGYHWGEVTLPNGKTTRAILPDDKPVESGDADAAINALAIVILQCQAAGVDVAEAMPEVQRRIAASQQRLESLTSLDRALLVASMERAREDAGK